MSKLRALIFDVDGTIADTERDGHRLAFNRAFANWGLDWEWSVELYKELIAIGGGKERILFYQNHYQPEFVPPIPLDRWLVELHITKSEYYQQLLASGAIPLRIGVKRLLSEAREQGIRLAIASTSALPNVTNLLTYTLGSESIDWFEIIAAGDIVSAKKPAPDIYHYVLQNLELSPSECVVLEDSPQGLQAALAANLTTIITVNDYTKNEDFAGAKLVLNHLGEPDHPFGAIAGNVGDASYLDLSLIRSLIA